MVRERRRDGLGEAPEEATNLNYVSGPTDRPGEEMNGEEGVPEDGGICREIRLRSSDQEGGRSEGGGCPWGNIFRASVTLRSLAFVVLCVGLESGAPPWTQPDAWGYRWHAQRQRVVRQDSGAAALMALRGGRIGRVPPPASPERRYLNLQLWEAARLGRPELLEAVMQKGAEIDAAYETKDSARR